MGSGRRNLFKLCECGSVLRSCEFKRHTRKGEGHKMVFEVAGCVPCLRFCNTMEERTVFYAEHSACPTGKANDAVFVKAVKEQRQISLEVC